MFSLRILTWICLLTVSYSQQREVPSASSDVSLVPTAYFLEDFNRDIQSGLFKKWGGGDVSANQHAVEASDQRIVQMLLPKGQAAGPTQGPNLEFQAGPFLYGTFEARLKTPRCTTKKEGNVSGFFTYFNDGKDQDGNGQADNREIDFEWLCADPESIYLTMWTDYDDASGGQRRVIRKINLARGIRRNCWSIPGIHRAGHPRTRQMPSNPCKPVCIC